MSIRPEPRPFRVRRTTAAGLARDRSGFILTGQDVLDDLDTQRTAQDSVAQKQPRSAVALRPLVPGMRWLLFTASVLVLLAGIQLFVFTGHTDHFFAWTIGNPLAAAFLGAAYWAAVPIGALAGRQALWANARIAVPAVLVFTVLTLTATLTHLGRLHLGARFATGRRS